MVFIFLASDAKSKIRLKCGDTDEVRPADFTRYSTVKQSFTPHVYEMAASTFIPPFNISQDNENNSDENSSEYYDDYENEIEKIITTTATSTTTDSTRPITNTFNLLNRRTTKAEDEFAFTEPSFLYPTKTQNIYYYSKTWPPKYEYFLSTKDFKRTTSLTPKTEKGFQLIYFINQILVIYFLNSRL